MCQSVARPSSAEYSHMGAMTIRLASSSLPMDVGLKSRDMLGSPGVGYESIAPRPARQPEYRSPERG